MKQTSQDLHVAFADASYKGFIGEFDFEDFDYILRNRHFECPAPACRAQEDLTKACRRLNLFNKSAKTFKTRPFPAPPVPFARTLSLLIRERTQCAASARDLFTFTHR